MANVSALTPVKEPSKADKKASLTSNKLSTTESEKSQFGVTGKLGTLGLGLDLTYGINDKINARLNLNGASADADGEQDDINYTGNLKGQTIGGLLDYHPTGGGFRISAGLYNNGNELDLDATGANNSNVQIGDRDYDLSGATLNTKVEFKSIAPYLGLGWGNAVDKDSKWGFSADLGVLFQGAPEAKLKATGIARDIETGLSADVGTDPTFQAELVKEQDNLNNGDLESFKFYPVVSVGVSYHF